MDTVMVMDTAMAKTINKNLIDIHCHLLFGVDDGSSSLEESIEMIKIYKEQGYTGAILTSHYRDPYWVDREKYQEPFEILKKAAAELDFSVYTGNEIFVDSDIVSKLNSNKIYPLANSNYVLVEFPFFGTPHYAKNLLFELQLEGYIPIIAHPERYEFIQNDIEKLYEFVNDGSLAQINLSSLKKEGTKIYNTVTKLLERNLISFAATDSHSSTWRRPNTGEPFKKLLELKGEDFFNEIIFENPNKLLANEAIYITPKEKPKDKPKKLSLIQRLFGKK